MNAAHIASATEERFLAILRGQLLGLRKKVVTGLSKETFERELQELQSDPVYASFGLASPEYALVRLVGRISISVGRRLGQLYDTFPKFVASARFGIPINEISPTVKKLQLDLAIPRKNLSNVDIQHVRKVLKKRGLSLGAKGVGIEVRYNFNPNDSARLRKDGVMAKNLAVAGYTPIYLVFSSISPREEAMKRLRKAGWDLISGDDAHKFANDLFQLDIAAIMKDPAVDAEIRRDVSEIMSELATSFAFQAVMKVRPRT